MSEANGKTLGTSKTPPRTVAPPTELNVSSDMYVQLWIFHLHYCGKIRYFLMNEREDNVVNTKRNVVRIGEELQKPAFVVLLM